MTRQLSIVTGCSAGATESFVVVPFELVKIKYVTCFPTALVRRLRLNRFRLQDKSLASAYSGPLDVVRQVVRRDGILGLYAGMEATFWRYVNPARPSKWASSVDNRTALRQALVVERRLLWIHLPSQDDASKGGGIAVSPACVQTERLDEFFFRRRRDNS